MNIREFLIPSHIFLGLHADDKAALLAHIAECVGDGSGVGQKTIAKALQAREKLGSTGVGNGIAIPHARIEGVKAPLGIFIRLDRAIDFASVDEKAVDIVFALLLPSGGAQGDVSALAAISRKLRDANVVAEIRKAARADDVYKVLTAPTP